MIWPVQHGDSSTKLEDDRKSRLPNCSLKHFLINSQHRSPMLLPADPGDHARTHLSSTHNSTDIGAAVQGLSWRQDCFARVKGGIRRDRVRSVMCVLRYDAVIENAGSPCTAYSCHT